VKEAKEADAINAAAMMMQEKQRKIYISMKKINFISMLT